MTVEDHYPQGGIGEAVASAVMSEKDIVIAQLAVSDIPRSGPSQSLIEKYGIGAESIVKAVKNLVQ